MEGTIDQSNLDVSHRVTGQHTFLHLLANPLVDTGTKGLVDRAAEDLVDKLVPRAAFVGREVDDHASELPRASGLFLMGILDVAGGPKDGLAIGDLLGMNVDLKLELFGHPVQNRL